MPELIPVVIDGKEKVITPEEFMKVMLSCELGCNRCGHHWVPRSNTPPKVCPNPTCKSPYWNKTRVRKIK